MIENHPQDSRVRIKEDGICQSLTGRMGTGGGNVPLILFVKSRRAQSKDDYETWVKGNVANTLNTFDGGGDVRATNIVVCEDGTNSIGIKSESRNDIR